MNPSIQSLYVRAIVPRITRTATIALAAQRRAAGVQGDGEFEDDGNYGSAATIDVEVLQSISKRVHYGQSITSFPATPLFNYASLLFSRDSTHISFALSVI